MISGALKGIRSLFSQQVTRYDKNYRRAVEPGVPHAIIGTQSSPIVLALGEKNYHLHLNAFSQLSWAFYRKGKVGILNPFVYSMETEAMTWIPCSTKLEQGEKQSYRNDFMFVKNKVKNT